MFETNIKSYIKDLKSHQKKKYESEVKIKKKAGQIIHLSDNQKAIIRHIIDQLKKGSIQAIEAISDYFDGKIKADEFQEKFDLFIGVWKAMYDIKDLSPYSPLDEKEIYDAISELAKEKGVKGFTNFKNSINLFNSNKGLAIQSFEKSFDVISRELIKDFKDEIEEDAAHNKKLANSVNNN